MILLLTFTVNRVIIVTVKSKQQPREGRKGEHHEIYRHHQNTGSRNRDHPEGSRDRRERAAYGYRAKQRVTARCIREAESVGRPTVRVGYCDLQDALSGITPDYYTAGVYGWNCDIYAIAGLTICTGYRPAAGVRAVGVRELADACRGADAATCDRLFAAWIVTNRERAREEVRA